MNKYYYTIDGFDNFAQAYGEGSYSQGNYNCQFEQQPGDDCPAAGTGSGGLSNTGAAITGIVALAALILLVAVLVRWWRRPRPVPVEVESDVRTRQTPQNQ